MKKFFVKMSTSHCVSNLGRAAGSLIFDLLLTLRSTPLEGAPPSPILDLPRAPSGDWISQHGDTDRHFGGSWDLCTTPKICSRLDNGVKFDN